MVNLNITMKTKFRKFMGVVVSLIIGAVMAYGISHEADIPLVVAIVVGAMITIFGAAAVLCKENRAALTGFLLLFLLATPVAYVSEKSFLLQFGAFAVMLFAFGAGLPRDEEILYPAIKKQ